MNRIATTFPQVDDPGAVGFKSYIINEAIAALPGIAEDVTRYLDVFSHQAAGKDDKYNFFRNEEENYEAINENKLGIVAVEQDLQDQLPEIAKQLKKKKVIFVTSSQIEVWYLSPLLCVVLIGLLVSCGGGKYQRSSEERTS